jgi:heat shock protein HtpX
MKRVFLFLATNIAVVLVLSITLRLLGVDSYLTETGLNYQSLLIFAALFGMGGAFISLAISKWSAKRMTGARVIETPSNETERWLVETVRRQAEKAGIGMPEVAIYNAPEINAFATGMNKNNALVAVSAGLLRSMSQDEAEAVLGHEISHVANGDMVTLALIQGVVNTFVIFLARVIGHFVDRVLVEERTRSRHRLLGDHHCRRVVARYSCQHDRHVLQPLARVSSRFRRRDTGRQGTR